MRQRTTSWSLFDLLMRRPSTNVSYGGRTAVTDTHDPVVVIKDGLMEPTST
jgi:hypothetical protein